jgi:hypothetical protein
LWLTRLEAATVPHGEPAAALTAPGAPNDNSPAGTGLS